MSYEECEVLSIVLDAFLCAQAALPHLIKAGGGTIVNIGGQTGHKGASERAHVITAKAGLAGMTKALALDLAPHQITVNCVVPGTIESQRGLPGVPERPAHRARAPPIGRRGEPEEIAAMVRMLCGPDARYITGQAIHVNGGGYLPKEDVISPVMRRLSAYIAEAGRETFPASTGKNQAPCARHDRRDGVRLAPSAREARHLLRQALGGTKEACVIGSRIVTSAANAALANGMCAHADETDDSRAFGHAPGLRHRARGAGRGRARRQQRRCPAARRRARVRRGDAPHDVAQCLPVPRGRALDPQLWSDIRRGRGRGIDRQGR